MWLSGSWFPGGQCDSVHNCNDQSQGAEELAFVAKHRTSSEMENTDTVLLYKNIMNCIHDK